MMHGGNLKSSYAIRLSHKLGPTRLHPYFKKNVRTEFP
jgi:hypothetical protein